MDNPTLFTDVLLPLALKDTYTYRVPRHLTSQVAVGKRVVVQFGKKKIYSALVLRIHQRAPSAYSVKYIVDVIDNQPVVNDYQLRFWQWLSGYYMCTPGEVMNAAMPTGMKLASETKIVMNPDFDGDVTGLNERELAILTALENNGVLTLTEVSAIVELKQVMNLIKNLIEKKIVIEEEEMRQKFKPKKEKYVTIDSRYYSRQMLNELMNSLEKRAPKQLDILLTYIKLSGMLEEEKEEVSKSRLIKESRASAAAMNALIEKNIFSEYDKVISRIKQVKAVAPVHSITLSSEQQQALESVKKGFEEKEVQLLHGVTGSGKTELYIHLIKETLDAGKQVLFLLPEIALTAQIINRIRKFFGEDTGIYHSRYSQNERVEVWNKMISAHPFKIIIGARSSVFLPYQHLGLVIVDEEHDTSYKQTDPAPRYHGRDAAIVLASLYGAKTLLGSATPAIESWFNAKKGKYALTVLDKRFGDVRLPKIELVDTIAAKKSGRMKSHFSTDLLQAVKQTLDKNEQVILFRNRRGFSLRVECDQCGYTPECKSCDVSLTFHKGLQKLKCHYCGYTASIPEHCPACGSKKMIMKGFGTEKIENELPVFFPEARVQRMDLDTTRGKNSYLKIINDFEEGRVDILVGTQMVTKGLDFDRVGLVGVLNADSMIKYPDFRAGERAYQMLVQVSGRAGRKHQDARVIIQTSQPENNVLQDVIHYDYETMVKTQLADRRNYHYPPYTRMIKIVMKHPDYQLINDAAAFFAKTLRQRLGGRVIGPEFPLVARIKNLFIKQIIIKVETKASISYVKKFLMEKAEDLSVNKHYKSVRVYFDVDPY